MVVVGKTPTQEVVAHEGGEMRGHYRAMARARESNTTICQRRAAMCARGPCDSEVSEVGVIDRIDPTEGRRAKEVVDLGKDIVVTVGT